MQEETAPDDSHRERRRFLGAEERIVRAVDMVKRERQGRVAAEERAKQAEVELRETDAADRIAGTRSCIALKMSATMFASVSSGLLGQLDALEL